MWPVADPHCGSVSTLKLFSQEKNAPSREELLALELARATPLSYQVQLQRPVESMEGRDLS